MYRLFCITDCVFVEKIKVKPLISQQILDKYLDIFWQSKIVPHQRGIFSIIDEEL